MKNFVVLVTAVVSLYVGDVMEKKTVKTKVTSILRVAVSFQSINQTSDFDRMYIGAAMTGKVKST